MWAEHASINIRYQPFLRQNGTFLYFLRFIGSMNISEEQENYFKLCMVVVDIFPMHLRQLFKREWKKKFNTIWTDGAQCGQVLLGQIKNAKRKPMKNVQENIESGEVECWDPTTLFSIFLYSGLELMEPCRQADQRHGLLRNSEELDSFRIIRNKFFAHVKSTSMSSIDFKDIIKKLKNIARNMFGHDVVREIEEKLDSSTELSKECQKQITEQKNLNDKYEEWLLGRIESMRLVVYNLFQCITHSSFSFIHNLPFITYFYKD